MQLKLLAATFALAGAAKLRTAPDVATRVAEEQQENIQIHDGFLSQEQKDVEQEKKVKSDKDLSALQVVHGGSWVTALDRDLKTQMLVQVKSFNHKDPCSLIECTGNLKCPAGFAVTEVPGHCCPYCVNPDIKVESAITGATGSHGGKASTFCDDVYCFPTMCDSTETAATTTNGQCCSVCA